MEAPFQTINDLTRFDNRLSPMARLFYAELCANITSNHGAFVEDEYYAGLFDVTTRQVKNWRKELKNFNYIKEFIDNISGKKCMLPTGNFEEKILNYKNLKASVTTNITYNTAEGKVLKSLTDAQLHFQAMIKVKQYSEKVETRVNYFINTLLSCAFDKSYFFKTYSGIKTTKEFFQFVLENITVDEIAEKAMYIFNEEKYTEIRQPDYYILATVASEFGREYEQKAYHIWKQEQRTNATKIEDEKQRLKQLQWDRKDEERKKEIMKNADKILNGEITWKA